MLFSSACLIYSCILLVLIYFCATKPYNKLLQHIFFRWLGFVFTWLCLRARLLSFPQLIRAWVTAWTPCMVMEREGWRPHVSPSYKAQKVSASSDVQYLDLDRKEHLSSSLRHINFQDQIQIWCKQMQLWIYFFNLFPLCLPKWLFEMKLAALKM